MGVILYYMLAGVKPFRGGQPKEVQQAILNDPVQFKHKKFQKISIEVQTLIRKLLQKDKIRRGKIQDIVKNAWLNKINPEEILSSEEDD